MSKNRQGFAFYTSIFWIFLLFVTMFCYLLAKQTGEFKLGFRMTWFEVGLLKNYSIEKYIDVLDKFKFNGVILEIWPWSQKSLDLRDAVNAYAAGKQFLKMVIVGGNGYLDMGVVNMFKDYDYVMVIDDAGDLDREDLILLKNMGLKTAMLHGYYPSQMRGLFNEGLVDYSMFMNYPIYEGDSEADSLQKLKQYRREVIEVKSWITKGMTYIPTVQFFGKAHMNWRFPTVKELEYIIDSCKLASVDGLKFMMPWTGQSDRGEYFEGWLDHPETWPIILK